MVKRSLALIAGTPQFLILFLTAMVFISAGISPAQETPQIIIRFLNGKNGKPISDKQITIAFDKGGNFFRDADSKGEVVLAIPEADLGELRVRPDYYFDCRFAHDQLGPGGLELKYSLDEIVSKGIVGENLCGKARVQSSPRVLTLYLRPRTLLEKWKL
jgi:hypothetical protein